MSVLAGIPCPDPGCGSVQAPPSKEDFVDYFEGRLWLCPACRHSEDLWSLLLARTLDDHPLMPGIVSLGLGAFTIVTTPLNRDVTLTVDFAEHGIPNDATIIDIVATPETASGGPALFPALGIQHLQIRGLPHSLVLHPVLWPSTQATGGPAATQVNILIIWVPAATEPEQEPLFSAGKAFTTGDYRGAIMPAQIAIELKLGQVLGDHFSQFAGKDAVRRFLNDGATYGYQLRFLLPSLFQAAGAPPLPDAVAAALQSLRRKRNRVGHEHHPTERAEAAPMLLGGVFGYQYVAAYGSLLGRASA